MNVLIAVRTCKSGGKGSDHNGYFIIQDEGYRNFKYLKMLVHEMLNLYLNLYSNDSPVWVCIDVITSVWFLFFQSKRKCEVQNVIKSFYYDVLHFHARRKLCK